MEFSNCIIRDPGRHRCERPTLFETLLLENVGRFYLIYFINKIVELLKNYQLVQEFGGGKGFQGYST